MAALMNLGRGWLRLLGAALLLWSAMAGQAHAALTVTTLKFAGAATTTAPAGSYVLATLTVTSTGGTNWRSIRYTWGATTYCLSFGSNAPTGVPKDVSLLAPSTVGTFSLTVTAFSRSSCRNTKSAVKVFSNVLTTYIPVALDHVQIEHDGSAQICAPEKITVKACSNAACSALYTGNVNVTLGATAGTWSSNPVTIAGGSLQVTLSNTATGTVTLSGAASSPTASSATTCVGGVSSNLCGLPFGSASCKLDAVEVGKAAATSIYTKLMGDPVTLDVLSLFNGSVDTTVNASVTARLVQSTAGGGCSTSALSNSSTGPFVSGRRSVTLTPTAPSRDVRVEVVSGGVTGCSTDNFAIRPKTLTPTIASVVSPFGATLAADPSGSSATATPTFKAATSTFTLNVAAVAGYAGVPTINDLMVNASAGNDGDLEGTLANTPSSGMNTGTFTYSEVGYFRLGAFALYDDTYTAVDSARLPSDCYDDSNLGTAVAAANPNVLVGGQVGCYFGNAQTVYFGRFIPDHFALDVGNAIINRSATSACSASTFTYMGEAMSAKFTLQAQNGNDDVTTNYSGTYARLNPQTGLALGLINSPVVGAKTAIPLCGATPVHPCYTVGANTLAFVEGEVDAALPLTLFRPAAAAGPFADLKLGIAPEDSDGVKFLAYDVDTIPTGVSNHKLVGTSIARYGRLNIDNAYGSELLNLKMKVKAQYYTGTVWATNTLDSCTPQAYLSFVSPTDYKDLSAANMPFSNLAPGADLALGVGSLVLAKPTSALTRPGSVNIKSGYPAYLPGNGRATFGVYKSGPVIYVRETY